LKNQLTYLVTLLLFLSQLLFGQNKIDLKANFNVSDKIIVVNQVISYNNTTNDTLSTIYLNDWSNSFSTKTTPLAKRFSEEFNTNFHFAKNEDRGYTVILSIKDHLNNSLNFDRVEDQLDIVSVNLEQDLLPGSSYNISLSYNIHLPNNKFTRYGISAIRELSLKYWYITPAVYNGKWNYYSNKNLDDLFIPKANITLEAEFPRNYVLTTELNLVSTQQNKDTQTLNFAGNNRIDSKLYLKFLPSFKTIQTDNFSIISDIVEQGLEPAAKAIITDQITSFITRHLGEYPHQKMLVTKIDAKKDPVYGLNQLPDFIRPFPKNFQYELQLLKNTLGNYLDNTLIINPRKDQWLKDGIQIYYLMKYIEEYYPDMKLLGTLANIWGIRSFHAADLQFNDQYNLVYMHMARTNRDQPLNMAKDSLLRFNAELANKYKAGIGLLYLDDYINDNIVESTVQEFLNTNKVKETSTSDFETLIKSKTPKDVNWFFTDYLKTSEKIDFKITKVKTIDDSIKVTIKNKRKNNMPISLFSLKKDSIVSKIWLNNITDRETFTIPKNDATKLTLNYDQTIPEYNLRDNWKSLKGLFSNNKPIQVRVFKDIEDPNYSQVFLMPIIEYQNIYDGLTLGAKIYNKTLLRKKFNYKFSPKYSTKSNSLTGSASVFIENLVEDSNLYNFSYGISGKYSSYAPDLFARVISPSLTFRFRDKTNFRSNKYQALNFRYLDISKDPDIFNISNNDQPDYAVFNVQFVDTNPGLINFYKWFADFQLSKDFGKISFNYEYRKLFENNHQLNLRFYFGSFIYNNIDPSSNYFSFALDRPSDYLFDYNYLGRSEESGIFSQQLIIAEGGFKSKLETPFANQWMTTMNMSSTIWKYVQGYADIGIVKNKANSMKFVYDSGIRINLVTDYFEVYFPIFSNLGWEIGNPNYDEKIRFVFTADPKSLLGLFRRKWY
jgi:hypothetical protein